MGFGIKIGNPIKSVTNAVSSAVNSVNKEVNNAVKSVERSDIGNVVKVAVQPVSTVNEMRKDIFKGKFESAGTRAIGMIGNNPVNMAINSSSTIRGAFERDNFFGSYAQTTDAFNKLQSGQSLTADESKIVALTYGKSAAMAGAAYALPAMASTASAWAVSNPTTATLIGTQLIKGSKTGNYSDAISTIGNSFAPGVGDVANGLLTPKQPTPGGTPGGGIFDFSSIDPQSSNKTMFYAIGAVLLILFLAIIKKMRS